MTNFNVILDTRKCVSFEDGKLVSRLPEEIYFDPPGYWSVSLVEYGVKFHSNPPVSADTLVYVCSDLVEKTIVSEQYRKLLALLPITTAVIGTALRFPLICKVATSNCVFITLSLQDINGKPFPIDLKDRFWCILRFEST